MPELKHLNGLDYLVVLFYLLMVAGVGIYASKFNRGASDYFKAGGKLPWVISSLSLFVSGFSAYMFVAASGFVYRNGLVSILVFTSAFGAYWLGYLVYGKLWRRARLESPMEILTRRFSPSTTYFYSIVSIVPNILLMGALLYTLSIFVASAVGLGQITFDLGLFSLTGFELILFSVGLVLLIYTVLGGLWAVAITDTIQFVVLLIMTLVVFPVTFLHLGEGSLTAGFAVLKSQAPAGYLSLTSGEVAFTFVAAFWLLNFMGYNANWHIGQRYYSIADERDTKKMAMTCAIFSLVAPLLWIAPALAARVIFPDMAALWPQLSEPTEASFASLCLLLLPHGFLGIVVSAMLAASMSSADSTFNWLAAVITKDVYVPIMKRLKNGVPSDKSQLAVGKGTVLVVGVLAIFTSLSMYKYGSSFDIYLKIFSLTVPAMLVPVMIGLIYRKTPWWSAIAASSIAITVTVIVNLWANVSAGVPISTLADVFKNAKLRFFDLELGKFELNVFVGGATSAAVFLLSSISPNKRPADVSRLAALDRDLKTPAYGEKSPKDVKGISSLKLVALLAALVGLMLLTLAVFSDTLAGLIINLLSGFGALLFGWLFWRLAKRYLRSATLVTLDEAG
jgi:Na+/proline symporter